MPEEFLQEMPTPVLGCQLEEFAVGERAALDSLEIVKLMIQTFLLKFLI